MSDNISTDRFLGIHATKACIVNLRHNLVRKDHSHTKLICQAQESTQELGQMCLARGKLTTTGEIRSIQ